MEGILVLPAAGADGRLRQVDDGFASRADDPFIPRALADRYPLRNGQRLTVEIPFAGDRVADNSGGSRGSGRRRRGRRNRRDGGGTDNAPAAAVRDDRKTRDAADSGGGGGSERPSRRVVDSILAIEGLDPQTYASRKRFEDLTPIDPSPRLTLEYKNCPPACRLIDLFCPIGYGTRGLIVSPPKAGKTVLLQQIAFGIKHNHPDVEVVALLIDERPEEVTDFKRNVPAQVFASSNDADIETHIDLGMLTIDRAKRMLEAGRDVVVLLDSLTRVGRAFNNSRRFASSGRTMSGGLDSRALDIPKQLFGSARKAEEGGSLTIIASCLVDTGSRADQIIFEEFKGTGNMELILDRSIAERRLYPAINLANSGTRKEHLLMSAEELKTVTALRRRLINMPPPQQIEVLLNALKRYPTNADLVKG